MGGDWDIRKGGSAPAGGARLYFCAGDAFSATENDLLLSWLDEDELRRHARCPRDGRLSFCRAHGLTRYCLSLWARDAGLGGGGGIHPRTWRFAVDARGKPRAVLPGGIAEGAAPPSFSLSHTRGAVTVAVAADGRLGVDVECRDRSVDALALAERHFAAEERADVFGQAGEPARRARFLLYWTLKEAYLKALGVGLAKPLSSFAFAPGAGSARLLYDDGNAGAGWFFPFFDMPPGMTVSLAIQAPEALALPAVRRFTLRPGSDWTQPGRDP